MYSRSSLFTLISALLLTIAAVLAYRVIPPKLIYFEGGPAPSFRIVSPWSDDQRLVAQWVSGDKLHLKCKMQSDGDLCLIDLLTTGDINRGIDLSLLSKLHIGARYQGTPSKFLVFMRSFNPAYSKINDPNSQQFLRLNLDTSEFDDGEVEIDLRELRVSDWWLDNVNPPRKLGLPDTSNITLIGLDFSSLANTPADVDLVINSLYIEKQRISKEGWYLVILIVWGIIIILVVTMQLINLLHERHRLRSKVEVAEARSSRDHLTQITNRRGMEERIKLLSETPNRGNTWLFLIDIDHFKRINDSLGHDAGDLVLTEFALIIKSSVRVKDLFARWGGEEFMLTCLDMNLDQAQLLAEKLRSTIASHRFLKPKGNRRVTVSIGVSEWLSDEPFNDALKRADIALYEAKGAGRNCWQINRRDGEIVF